MATNALVEALDKKVNSLIAENRDLRAELTKAIAAKERSEKKRTAAEEATRELEKRVKTLETAASFLGTDENNKAARMRINKLVREIDSCIAMINKW